MLAHGDVTDECRACSTPSLEEVLSEDTGWELFDIYLVVGFDDSDDGDIE
jgi:hypothetical protein